MSLFCMRCDRLFQTPFLCPLCHTCTVAELRATDQIRRGVHRHLAVTNHDPRIGAAR